MGSKNTPKPYYAIGDDERIIIYYVFGNTLRVRNKVQFKMIVLFLDGLLIFMLPYHGNSSKEAKTIMHM